MSERTSKKSPFEAVDPGGVTLAFIIRGGPTHHFTPSNIFCPIYPLGDLIFAIYTRATYPQGNPVLLLPTLYGNNCFLTYTLYGRYGMFYCHTLQGNLGNLTARLIFGSSFHYIPFIRPLSLTTPSIRPLS